MTQYEEQVSADEEKTAGHRAGPSGVESSLLVVDPCRLDEEEKEAMPLPTTDEEAEQPKRRILCIDGGGVLGTFPAAFLDELEWRLNSPIASYFDLIAGTSTGGIIAVALALGHRASEILDFHEQRSPEVFGKDHGPLANLVLRALRGCRWFYRHKYDSDALCVALREILGDRRIGHARTRLVIPAWNPVARSVYIYKTAHHPRLETDYRSSAVDAALATSAAPTYFRHHITRHEPPRVYRRVNELRGESHEFFEQVLPGSPGTSRAHGVRAPVVT